MSFSAYLVKFPNWLWKRLPCNVLSLVLLTLIVVSQSAPSGATETTISAAPLNVAVNDVVSADFTQDDKQLYLLISGRNHAEEPLSLTLFNSTDGGHHWTSLSTISPSISDRIRSDRGNDVQIAIHDQHMVIAWRVDGNMPYWGKIAIASSADHGKTWQRAEKPLDVSEDFDQGYMDLAVDKNGVFHFVWLDDREESGNHQGLRYARSSTLGVTWADYQTIDQTTCTCCATTLVSTPELSLHVLYRNESPRDMLLAQSMDSGKSWQKDIAVGQFGWEFVGCPHTDSGLSVTPVGQQLYLDALVWTGISSAPGLYFLRSTDSGLSWSQPLRLVQAITKHNDILTVNPETILAVWDSVNESGSSIMLANSTDGGKAWSLPKQISATGVEADYPRILATTRGTRIFWLEKQTAGTRMMMAQPN